MSLVIGLFLLLLFVLLLLFSLFLLFLFLLSFLVLLLLVFLVLSRSLFLLLFILSIRLGSRGRGGLGAFFLHAELVSDGLDGRGLVGLAEEELPSLGGRVGHAAELVQLAGGLQVLLLLGEGAKLPLALVDIAVHDHALGARNDAVVASRDGRGGHRSDGDRDGFSLGGDEDDLAADFDAGLVTEDSREHKLGSVADGVDRGVLDDNPGVLDEEDLKGHDDSAEIGLVAELVVVPLGVFDVVHGHHSLVLLKGSRADSAKLLHMRAATKDIADVHAESTHVGSGLAGDPEDTHVALLIVVKELALVDGSHSEFLLDGGDQRWSLEDRSGQTQKSLLNLLDFLDVLMQLDDGHVLFTS